MCEKRRAQAMAVARGRQRQGGAGLVPRGPPVGMLAAQACCAHARTRMVSDHLHGDGCAVGRDEKRPVSLQNSGEGWRWWVLRGKMHALSPLATVIAGSKVRLYMPQCTCASATRQLGACSASRGTAPQRSLLLRGCVAVRSCRDTSRGARPRRYRPCSARAAIGAQGGAEAPRKRKSSCTY